jgi:hypothetical protein
MTTIAWDGKTVAADSLKVYGAYASPGNYEKIIQRAGIVFACAGNASLFEPMIKWYLDGADPKECPCVGKDEAALLVFRDDKAFYYRTEAPYADEPHAPDAWGAGSEFAIGAMHAGADARRAIEIAITCSPFSGRDVVAVELAEAAA